MSDHYTVDGTPAACAEIAEETGPQGETDTGRLYYKLSGGSWCSMKGEGKEEKMGRKNFDGHTEVLLKRRRCPKGYDHMPVASRMATLDGS